MIVSIKFNTSQIKANLVYVLLQICAQYGFVTFVIDDAHYMDSDSWTYLEDLGKDPRALIVLTYKPKRAGAIFPNVAVMALAQETTQKNCSARTSTRIHRSFGLSTAESF